MKRLPPCVFATLLVVGCGPKPEDAAARFETIFNGGDPAQIMSQFADDPYVEIDGIKMLNKEEIGAWMSENLMRKPQVAATSGRTGADGRLSWTMTMQRNDWAQLKLEPLPYHAEAVFDKDKVKMLRWTMDDTSKILLKSTIDSRNTKWLTAIQDAIKTRNPKGVQQLVVDDVRFDTLEKTDVKKSGIIAWVNELTKSNADLLCCSKRKDEDTWTGTIASDELRTLGINQGEVVTSVGFAEDGHIKDFGISYSPETKTKIDTAKANGATTAAATPPPKKHR